MSMAALNMGVCGSERVVPSIVFIVCSLTGSVRTDIVK